MEDDSESLFYFGNLNYTPEQSQQFKNYNHHNDSNIDMTEQNHDPLPFVNDDEDPFLKDIIFDFDEKSHKNKATAKTNQILDKLNKFEDTYYNNITSLPNTDVQLHDKQILIKNIHLIQNTLPGLLITFLLKNNNIPMPENILYGIAFKQYNELRKPNGSKYKV